MCPTSKMLVKGLWRYLLLPALVAAGSLAIASGLIEGPSLQPFLYGVF